MITGGSGKDGPGGTGGAGTDSADGTGGTGSAGSTGRWYGYGGPGNLRTSHTVRLLGRPGSRLLAGGAVQARRTELLPPWVRVLPPGLLVLALVLELSTPTRYSFASFLTAAVVLAALLTRPLATLLTGALAIALLAGLHLGLEEVYPDNVTGPIITLVLVTGFATLLATILERTTVQLVQVQAVAEATQRALLRPLPERLGPVRLAGLYRAADEAALIGGDLYSVRPTPYGVRAVIGDVRGKGLGATEGVATIISAFREAAMVCATLSEVADRIEAAIAMDRQDMETGGSLAAPAHGAASGSSQELFATAVLLEFPQRGGLVRVLNRGHPPVFRIGGPDGVRALPAEPGLPLGFGDMAPAESRRPGGPADQGVSGVGASGSELPELERSWALAEGETLVAYSDGLTEARDRRGSFYPLRQRLAARYGDGGAAAAAGDAQGHERDEGEHEAEHGHEAKHGHEAGVEPAHPKDGAWAGDPEAPDPVEVVSFIHGDVTRWAQAINDDLVIVVLQHDTRIHGARVAEFPAPAAPTPPLGP